MQEINAWRKAHGAMLSEAGGPARRGVEGHETSPSLGHYASLSFVVIGEGQRNEARNFFCGRGFQPRPLGLNDLGKKLTIRLGRNN
jgi:hypothetical protein